MTLAFAGYGFIAAAPAHAHSDNHGYTIYAVAWDADLVGNHHADEDHDHDHDHHDATDHGGDVVGKVGAPADHGGLHVHAVAAFITVSGTSPVPQLISASVMRWVERAAGDVSGLFSPLKKPPRTFL